MTKKVDIPEWPLDLSSLAVHAAIELDCLRRGKPTELKDVSQLVSDVLLKSARELLTTETDPKAHLYINLTVALILWEACAVYFSHRVPYTWELGKEIQKVIKRFKKFLHNPQEAAKRHPKLLEKLSTFCLNISQEALRREDWHPFRHGLAA